MQLQKLNLFLQIYILNYLYKKYCFMFLPLDLLVTKFNFRNNLNYLHRTLNHISLTVKGLTFSSFPEESFLSLALSDSHCAQINGDISNKDFVRNRITLSPILWPWICQHMTYDHWGWFFMCLLVTIDQWGLDGRLLCPHCHRS